MEKTNNSFIKLKEGINEKDYGDIGRLMSYCLKYDKTSLKLELDYKLSCVEEKESMLNCINDFMYYVNEELVGYIGICHFGGSTLEVNGMVHPEYRRRGIFKQLFALVKEEWSRRENLGMLLLCDSDSIAGQEFVRSIAAFHDHTEYEMYLMGEPEKPLAHKSIVLRKANNSDGKEISRQNAIYFGCDEDETPTFLPEEEEKHGRMIYMVELNSKIIGKVHLDIGPEINGIFGLGIVQEFRGKGYGRELLMASIEKMKETNASAIMLQVAAKNSNALNLYKSCGFVQTSTMDYYGINK